jgi:hypothetical protein
MSVQLERGLHEDVPVPHSADLKVALSNDAGQHRGRISTTVVDGLVMCRPKRGVCGYRDKKLSTRPKHPVNLLYDPDILFNVFEYVVGNNEIE